MCYFLPFLCCFFLRKSSVLFHFITIKYRWSWIISTVLLSPSSSSPSSLCRLKNPPGESMWLKLKSWKQYFQHKIISKHCFQHEIILNTLFSTWNHIKNIVFNMKSYHNRGLFRTFPLLPCIQCSSLSKKEGKAMMVIEPILILVDLCWCTIHCDFNHSDMQRVLPISNSFLRLFGIRWLHYLERPCNSNHHYNCSLYITDILIAFLSPPAVTNYC